MNEIIINYWAVLAAGIASMIIGALWYSPVLFGKMWMKLSDMTPEKMAAEGKNKNMAGRYGAAFVSTLVMSYILAHFLAVGGATTSSEALTAAFWLWLGFMATVKLDNILWGGDSVKLFLFNITEQIVAIGVMAVILTLWK